MRGRRPTILKKESNMPSRSRRIVLASLLGIAGACTTESTTTPYYYYDAYAYPVVDYGYVDTMVWYDGYYDPYIGYATLTGSSPGAGLVKGTPDAGRGAAFPRPLLGLFAAWRVVLQHDCASMAEWTDSDEDGVPASYETNFNC